MLNSLRDGQISYENSSCPSAHIPPHNVVTPIQNSLLPTEPSASLAHSWSSNHRFEQLYGFHSRYYNLDYPAPYSPATNQYTTSEMYGQSSQCCQPCCRIRTQNISKRSPPQVMYNTNRPPVPQVNRSYKQKKTSKPCNEQFLPYIPNELPIKYNTQNCYQEKYNNSYISNSSYCPPTHSNSNLWISPHNSNTNWSDRLHSNNRYSGVQSDYDREKNYQKLSTNYQSVSNPAGVSSHHKPYNYVMPPPSMHNVHNYRSPYYHNAFKNNVSDYKTQSNCGRVPLPTQNNQVASNIQQYYNNQPLYQEFLKSNEPSKTDNIGSSNSLKSNLNVREFLATWDEGEDDNCEKSLESTPPIVVLDCMPLEGDALAKVQEKLNVVTYENLEKVLKENPNSLILNSEPDKIDLASKIPKNSKSNFEPIDYTKRETGIIKPFNTEQKDESELLRSSEKNYSNANFDRKSSGYGKKNTGVCSTEIIERLAERIFNKNKSLSETNSFESESYSNQNTQPSRTNDNTSRYSSHLNQNQQMFYYQQRYDKYNEPNPYTKNDYLNQSTRIQPSISHENNKLPIIKYSNTSCIVENESRKWSNFNHGNPEANTWDINQSPQEPHMSHYDHSVIAKPLDFSALTDEHKNNPYTYDKNIDENRTNQFNKVNDIGYTPSPTLGQHILETRIDSTNRNFPVIVSSHITRQEYNGFHESVIQRTGCDKNRNEKVAVHSEYENLNWNLTNDLNITKNNNNSFEESSCYYEKNNYNNVLNNMSPNKNCPIQQWKNNQYEIDMNVKSKPNSSQDSFFDGWNYIDTYGNSVNIDKKDNEQGNRLFSNQNMAFTEANQYKCNPENENRMSHSNEPYSEHNQIMSNECSRDVFNLNNQIPDFNDSFELLVTPEQSDYLHQKNSENNEHRADGSIFEQITDPKSISTIDLTKSKNDQLHKFDSVGLPSFKDKEPLAPMAMPQKLNVVKPILRDPSQMYTVIKQKKLITSNNDNTNNNKLENATRVNSSNHLNHSDIMAKLKSNIMANHYDMWSEKYVFKDNSAGNGNSVAQCDIQNAQPKNNQQEILETNIILEHQQNKESVTLLENVDPSNITEKKNIEAEKNSSSDFLNCCVNNTKGSNQRYREALDEFDTSFGFDIHCSSTRTTESFHEDIVDKCLEERVNDQIGKDNVDSLDSSNNTSVNEMHSSNNITQSSFNNEYQPNYLIKQILNSEIKLSPANTQISDSKKTEGLINFDYQVEIRSNLDLIADKVTQSILNDVSTVIQPELNIKTNESYNLDNSLIKSDDSKIDDSFVSKDDNSNILKFSTPSSSPLLLIDTNLNCKLDNYQNNYCKSNNLDQHSEINKVITDPKLSLKSNDNSNKNEVSVSFESSNKDCGSKTDDSCNKSKEDEAGISKNDIKVISIESENGGIIEIHEFLQSKNNNQSHESSSINSFPYNTKKTAEFIPSYKQNDTIEIVDNKSDEIVKKKSEIESDDKTDIINLQNINQNNLEIIDLTDITKVSSDPEEINSNDSLEIIYPYESLSSSSLRKTDLIEVCNDNKKFKKIKLNEKTGKFSSISSNDENSNDTIVYKPNEIIEFTKSEDDKYSYDNNQFDELEVEVEIKRTLNIIYENLDLLIIDNCKNFDSDNNINYRLDNKGENELNSTTTNNSIIDKKKTDENKLKIVDLFPSEISTNIDFEKHGELDSTSNTVLENNNDEQFHLFRCIKNKINSKCNLSIEKGINEQLNDKESCETDTNNTINNEDTKSAKTSVVNIIRSTPNAEIKEIIHVVEPSKPEEIFKTTRGYNTYRPNEVETPRIKFMLKCKNMIKKNIFDTKTVLADKKVEQPINSEFIGRKFYKKKRPLSFSEIVTKSEELKDYIIENDKISLCNTDDPVITTQSNGKICLPDVITYSKDKHYENSPITEWNEDNLSIVVNECIREITDNLESYYSDLSTPVPSPLNDFSLPNDASDSSLKGGSIDYWDKSLEIEYKNVLRKTISKFAKTRVTLRDKCNVRWIVHRIYESKRRKRKRKNIKLKKNGFKKLLGKCSETYKTINTIDNIPITTLMPNCKIKVQLPWGRIFNLNNQNNMRKGNRDTKLELGPAKVEVRLCRTPSEWQVAACHSQAPSKSVVSVKRLVLRKASTSPRRHSISSSSDSDCSSISRQLPKIVIRRSGHDNYTSHVSGSDLDMDRGDDSDDNRETYRRCLVVMIERNPKLDEMALSGVKTLNLKQIVPISSDESADANTVMVPTKKARYA